MSDRLEEIRQRYEACVVRVKPADESRENVYCPLCDGDGQGETILHDTDVPADEKTFSYVGIQAFGVGDRMARTDTFLNHLSDDMAWLLAEVESLRRQCKQLNYVKSVLAFHDGNNGEKLEAIRKAVPPLLCGEPEFPPIPEQSTCGFVPYAACTRERGHDGPCAHMLNREIPQ